MASYGLVDADHHLMGFVSDIIEIHERNPEIGTSQLTEIVEKVLPLRRETKWDVRKKFVSEIRRKGKIDAQEVERQALEYCRPSPEELYKYVDHIFLLRDLSPSILIFHSPMRPYESWGELRPDLEKVRDHFVRLESQYGVRLGEYIPLGFLKHKL